MRYIWHCGLLALLCLTTLAGVDLRTNIRDVDYVGPCEEAGAITMSASDDAFPNASLNEPVFIKIHLLNGVRLCQTLVEIDAASTSNLPIYLGMRIEGSYSALIAAHPDTVSIVRWRRGESDIWLRVQSSSSTWVDRDSELGPTSIDAHVAWTFGITAQESYQRLFVTGDYNAGRANLPANYRKNSGLPIEQSYVSTLIAIDLSQANIHPFPSPNKHVEFAHNLFAAVLGLDTAPTAQGISAQSQYLPSLSNHDWIGFGFNYRCTFFGMTFSDQSAQLCKDNELTYLPVTLSLDQFFCEDPRILLRLRVPQEQEYGFPIGNLVSGEEAIDPYAWWGNDPSLAIRPDYHVTQGINSEPTIDITSWAPVGDSIFVTSTGETLAREIMVEFTPPPGSLLLHLEVAADPIQLPTQVSIEAELSSLGDHWLDTRPGFEMTQLRSPPIPIVKDHWWMTVGQFQQCQGEQ